MTTLTENDHRNMVDIENVLEAAEKWRHVTDRDGEGNVVMDRYELKERKDAALREVYEALESYVSRRIRSVMAAEIEKGPMRDAIRKAAYVGSGRIGI